MKCFKKAEMALTIILTALIVVVFLGWLINFTSKECRSNSDCGQDSYCGSDFSCHQIPVIEKTIVKNNLILPSIIVGIAVIIAAIILRREKTNSRNRSNQEAETKEHKNPLRTP